MCIEKDDLGYWIGTEGGLVYWTNISSINEHHLVNKPTINILNNILNFPFKGDINIYSLDGKRVFSAYNESCVNLFS